MGAEFKKIDGTIVEKVARDFSKYCDVDLETKLSPINQSIENMQTRMEEFQFILLFAQKNCTESGENINYLLNMKPEFQDLCTKIDRVMDLTTKLTGNINSLEKIIEKEEMDMGIYDTATKVSNILTPLFKRSATEDKKKQTEQIFIEAVEVEDYFN